MYLVLLCIHATALVLPSARSEGEAGQGGLNQTAVTACTNVSVFWNFAGEDGSVRAPNEIQSAGSSRQEMSRALRVYPLASSLSDGLRRLLFPSTVRRGAGQGSFRR